MGPVGEELKSSCQHILVLEIKILHIFSLWGTFLVLPCFFFFNIYTYGYAPQAEKKKDPMLLMLLLILWTMKILKWRKFIRNKSNFTLSHCLSLWSFTNSLPLLQRYSYFQIPCGPHSLYWHTWLNLQQSSKVCASWLVHLKMTFKKGNAVASF